MLNTTRTELIEALAATYKPEKKRNAQPSTNGHAPPNGKATAAVIEQARRYIAAIPGGVQGDNGSKPTITVAAHLVRGFCLGEEDALTLLREWSDANCQPPWNDAELRHKIESAVKHGGETGYLLNRQQPPPQQHHGVASQVSRSDAEKREPVKFKRITSRELATSVYEIEYYVDRFLVANQPCIFAGPKKTLKTTILLALAIALARGVPFLGRFKVEQARRVLVMSGESGLSVLQETAKRICKWHDGELENLDNLIWSSDLPQIACIDHLDALEAMLRDDEIEVVIIDPAYLAMPSDDSANLFAMGALLGNLARVCRENGATLILAHHTKKGGIANPYEPPELENIAFAGFQEFARQWILTGRRERYEHGTGSHKLWLSTGGSAGHSGLWALDIEEGTNTAKEGRTFDATLASPEAAIDNAKSRKERNKEAALRDKEAGNRNRALAALFKAGEPLTKRDWRGRCGLNDPAMDQVIEALLDSESIVCVDVVKSNRKKPYDAFDVSPGERERLAKLAIHEDVEKLAEDPNADLSSDF